MRIDVLTLFPTMFQGPLTESVVQRAREEGILDLRLHDLREFGIGTYKQVDDRPYGGGAGMVMRADVVSSAIEAIASLLHPPPPVEEEEERGGGGPHRIYLSPRGRRLTQAKVEALARKSWLLLICGHYEGVDQRVIDGWVDVEISVGDYVLTGGELPAMVLIDAVSRQIPGVLGKEESVLEESFSRLLQRKKEYPHYTRPEDFRGMRVPEVLLSGDHRKIAEWRKRHIR